MNTNVYNHFERFDIEGDEGTQPNFSYGEHVEIPTTIINSPPPEEVQRAEEIPVHHGCKEARQDEQRQGPVKRKPRKQAGTVIDYEQTVIPGNIYQSWLQNASDISRRGTNKKVHRDIISTMKIRSLMELEVKSEPFLAPNQDMVKSIQDDPTRKGLIHHPDNGSSLEPVAEEPTWQFTEPNFKISRLSENGPTPDHCTTL